MLSVDSLKKLILDELKNNVSMSVIDDKSPDLSKPTSKTVKPFDSSNVPDIAKMTYTGESNKLTGLESISLALARKIIEHVQLNMALIYKPRVDQYATELDTLILALTTIAATATATGTAPVTGAALGALLTTVTVAMTLQQGIRKGLLPTEIADQTTVQTNIVAEYTKTGKPPPVIIPTSIEFK